MFRVFRGNNLLIWQIGLNDTSFLIPEKENLMPDKLPFTALILSGGKSSRMGRDKALLPFGGQTMLENIAKLTGRIFEETLIVVNDRLRIEGLDLRHVKVYEDLFKNKGPLAGIYTGLSYSKTQASCVFTCDMPFIDETLIRELADFWEEGVDALAFEDPEGNLQPFPGVYGRSARFLIRTLLHQGESSMRRFLGAARVKPFILKQEKISILTNMNTIEDYYEILKLKEESAKE